jgi:hypothetical protein
MPLLVADVITFPEQDLSCANCVIALNEETVRIKKQSDGQFVISGKLMIYASVRGVGSASIQPIKQEDFQRTITAQQMSADPVALVYAQVAKRYTNVTMI